MVDMDPLNLSYGIENVWIAKFDVQRMFWTKAWNLLKVKMVILEKAILLNNAWKWLMHNILCELEWTMK